MKKGDCVKLIKIPPNRYWVTKHSKLGMKGVIVENKKIGSYDYLVYWFENEYTGQDIDGKGNHWQSFFVEKNQIKKLSKIEKLFI